MDRGERKMMENSDQDKSMGGGIFKYVSGKRYVFLLTIDGRQTITLGRYRRREGIERVADNLKRYRGYAPEIIDTGGKNAGK
jgi:hypothetical protein